MEALWHLHEAPGSQFDVRFTADFVRAKEGGRPLPRLPEARAGVGLLWASAAWTFAWPLNAARSISLVEVLPTDPVTPTTRARLRAADIDAVVIRVGD